MKHNRFAVISVLGLLWAGCAAVSHGARTTPACPCAPTGWVDRVEEGWAVLEPDLGDSEEYLPVECFPEIPREGTRVVDGRIDWKETRQIRERIRGLLEQMEEAE